MIEVEIYWNDLTDDAKKRLIDAGFDNSNVIDGTFPLTFVVISDSTTNDGNIE